MYVLPSLMSYVNKQVDLQMDRQVSHPFARSVNVQGLIPQGTDTHTHTHTHKSSHFSYSKSLTHTTTDFSIDPT